MGNTGRRDLAPRRPVARQALGAAAAVCLFVGAASSSALPPTQDTDAAFTAAQSAQGAVQSGTVPPVENLQCRLIGGVLSLRPRITWDALPSSDAITGIEVVYRRSSGAEIERTQLTASATSWESQNASAVVVDRSVEVTVLGPRPGSWTSEVRTRNILVSTLGLCVG